VLIEGAWTYRMQARVSRKLHDRLELAPDSVRDIAWKAQIRLCGRYRHLVAAGKARVIVTTAIAREMVGFIWAIARQVQLKAGELTGRRRMEAQYPAIAISWRRHWAAVIPFFAFPGDVRRIIYTTDEIDKSPPQVRVTVCGRERPRGEERGIG
jgi:hypothetical protein